MKTKKIKEIFIISLSIVFVFLILFFISTLNAYLFYKQSIEECKEYNKAGFNVIEPQGLFENTHCYLITKEGLKIPVNEINKNIVFEYQKWRSE